MESIKFLLQKKTQKTAPTLIEAVFMIAKLGGFLGRKGDGLPGPHVIAKGLRRLSDIVHISKIVSEENFEKIMRGINIE